VQEAEGIILGQVFNLNRRARHTLILKSRALASR
jgi:hypothetical protein